MESNGLGYPFHSQHYPWLLAGQLSSYFQIKWLINKCSYEVSHIPCFFPLGSTLSFCHTLSLCHSLLHSLWFYFCLTAALLLLTLGGGGLGMLGHSTGLDLCTASGHRSGHSLRAMQRPELTFTHTRDRAMGEAKYELKSKERSGGKGRKRWGKRLISP